MVYSTGMFRRDSSKNRSDSVCCGPVDRRQWLQLGALSMGALCSGLTPSDAVLATNKKAVSDAYGDPLPELNDDFSVILFWANGGPSHLDLFDLKPDAPREYRGPFSPIQTNVNGIEICELMPQLSRMADKFTLIRSMHHERAEHSGGTNRFLTGYPSIAANLPRSEFPDMGSVLAKHAEYVQTPLPFFVANTPSYGAGAAYLGPSCEAFMPSPNLETASGANRYDPVAIYKSSEDSGDLSISPGGVVDLSRRREVLGQLDRLSRDIDNTRMMSAMDLFQQRAAAMLASTKAKQAFDLSLERQSTLERYGNTHWGKSLLTCRRLVESGVRFVQCQATFRLRPETGRTSTWDDHSVNAHIFKSYEEKIPVLDQAVSALIEDLYSRGLDKKVLFIFCGEFGRTPLIRNQDASGRPGRDHWPQAMSVFLSGGGMPMGQVIGATSKRAEEPVERIMNSNCLLATIYRKFGVDSKRSFLNNAGRPIPILTEGEPIHELL